MSSNPKCLKQVSTWYSQPVMPGTGIPAANSLLCIATLLAGGSANNVLQIFKQEAAQQWSSLASSNVWISCWAVVY